MSPPFLSIALTFSVHFSSVRSLLFVLPLPTLIFSSAQFHLVVPSIQSTLLTIVAFGVSHLALLPFFLSNLIKTSTAFSLSVFQSGHLGNRDYIKKGVCLIGSEVEHPFCFLGEPEPESTPTLHPIMIIDRRSVGYYSWSMFICLTPTHPFISFLSLHLGDLLVLLLLLYHHLVLVAHGTASSLTPRSIPTSPSTTWNSTPSSLVSSSSAASPPGSGPSVSLTATHPSSPRRLFLSRTRPSCTISLNSPVCTRSTPISPPSLSHAGAKSTASSASPSTKTSPEPSSS